MRLLEKTGFALFLLAGALVAAGEYLDLPWMLRVALIAVGLMSCLGGMRAIRKGEVVGGFYEANYLERMVGPSAWLLGGILIVGGVMVVGLAALDLYSRGQAGAIVTRLVLGSSLGLAVALGLSGLIVTAFGVVRTLSGSAKANGPFSPHVELGFRVAGFVSVLVGLAMLLSAAGLVVAPDSLSGLLQRATTAVKDALGN